MKIRDLPSKPGVYIFMDSAGKAIYTGKAADIKKRVRSHFSGGGGPRQFAMISRVRTVDFITTKNEQEALVLEDRLIKELQPRYNILLRDDKTYPFMEITLGEKYPVLKITREKPEKKSRVFGPFPNTADARRAARILEDIFLLRKCKKFTSKEKPCLNWQIKKCLSPCTSQTDPDEYSRNIEELLMFLEGNRKKLLQRLKKTMNKYKKNLQYEKAARARDRITALESIFPMVNFRKINAEKIKALRKIDPLEDIKNIIKLKTKPVVIEGFDISHTSSGQAAGSSVRFTAAVPDKPHYRKYNIKQQRTSDDLKMIKEVVYRRMKRLKEEKAQLPDIILIDGGKGQEEAAKQALKLLNIEKIKVLALAKEKGNIYYNGKILDMNKNSEAFKLLKRIDKEAHRFAHSHHLKRRKKESEN